MFSSRKRGKYTLLHFQAQSYKKLFYYSSFAGIICLRTPFFYVNQTTLMLYLYVLHITVCK